VTIVTRIRLLVPSALLLIACASPPTVGTVRIEGRPLPDLTGTGLQGERLSSVDLRGHVVVVSVWATWCLDCEKDQPGFVNVAERYADRGVRFLGVDPLDTTAPAQEWVRRYQVPYPSIQDPSGRFAASLGYSGMPATYVVDRDGTIRFSIIGSTTSEAMLSGLLDQVLAEASASPAQPA
jgi:cytochrome c biogenesis protein CcmG/thiol:disulfide interchange protein DsbE